MRMILYFLAVLQVANGLFMILTPELWYSTIPGVVETGGFNHHFVVDIGVAFLASAASLYLSARAGGDITLLWPAAIFLGGHAGFHLIEMLEHFPPASAIARDLVIIVVPQLVPLAIIFINFSRPKELSQ